MGKPYSTCGIVSPHALWKLVRPEERKRKEIESLFDVSNENSKETVNLRGK